MIILKVSLIYVNSDGTLGSGTGNGRFLQISGLQFAFNPNNPVQERIVSVNILSQGNWVPLQINGIYTIAAPNFLQQGGDNYGILVTNALPPINGKLFSFLDLFLKRKNFEDFGPPLDQLLFTYVTQYSPISANLDERISISNGPGIFSG